jgi:hypothetical protein
MKKFLSVMIMMIGLLFSFPPGNEVKASTLPDQTSVALDNPNIQPVGSTWEEGGVQAIPEQTNVEQDTVGNFFSDNWVALLLGLLGFFDLVARLTPTEKDNSIVNFLLTVFNAVIPNFRKGGGSFKLLSK